MEILLVIEAFILLIQFMIDFILFETINFIKVQNQLFFK
jgi:hypothetical protein